MTNILTEKHPEVEYEPSRLLDHLCTMLGKKSDAGLARSLDVTPPMISKIRHKKLAVGCNLLIRMHEVSGLSIREIRLLMGDRREKFCGYAGPQRGQ